VIHRVRDLDDQVDRRFGPDRLERKVDTAHQNRRPGG
jgi:hypothetical protein